MKIPPLDFKSEVQAALNSAQPVVALESTLIAHGLPWPENLHCAQRLENTVREHGAVPATIAVLGGRIKIGLSSSELEYLAQGQQLGHNIAKLSRRDLAWSIAQGGAGATTVAGTMLCAHLAGIRLFATGGIGGVHRGAEQNFDIFRRSH